jgi:hypothetical protein
MRRTLIQDELALAYAVAALNTVGRRFWTTTGSVYDSNAIRRGPPSACGFLAV